MDPRIHPISIDNIFIRHGSDDGLSAERAIVDTSSEPNEGWNTPREELTQPRRVPKTSISFILDSHQDKSGKHYSENVDSPSPQYDIASLLHVVGTQPPLASVIDSTSSKAKAKRKSRICTQDGCTKYVVDRGRCIRHGGGKRCQEEGCECRAQNHGLCWKHGGYNICKVEGCEKRAKSKGICWSHGGGTRCSRDGCTKVAVSRSLCWAHGGGKRCQADGCQKAASNRTKNYCYEHYHLYFYAQNPNVVRIDGEPKVL